MDIGVTLTHSLLNLSATLLLKSLFVFAAAGMLLLVLRRSSAAARHLVCLLTLGATLALPLFSLALPGWHLPVLAARQAKPTSVRPSPALAMREGKEAGQTTTQTTHTVPAVAPLLASSLIGRTPPRQGGGFLTQGDGFLLLYALGLFLASLRPLLGLWGIRRLGRRCTPVDEATLTTAAACASLLSLRAPRLCRADVPVPMTWGWRRPVVVLPLMAAGWPEARLRSVLLHEMAHVKRRDWPGHRLADFACAIYWFHPLVWLTARRLRAESEAACDDLVLASGIPAPDYARHLLEIASALPRVPNRSQAAIAMAQTSKIESRLHMILDKTRTRRVVARRILLAALVPGTVILIALAVLRPDAKAQAIPAPSAAATSTASNSSTTLPNGVWPSNLRFGHITTVMMDNQGGPPSLITSPELTIGGTSLFAGITNANKPGSPWWSATGTLLPTPVYDTNAYHSSSFVDPSKHTVSLAFRLPPTASDMTVRYELPQSLGSSSDGSWPTKLAENAHRTEAEVFSRTNGSRVVTAQFPAALLKTTIKVGIASGAWKTAASYAPTPGGFGNTDISSNSKFLFSPVAETKDGTIQSVATDETEDLRVVVVDVQGKESLPVLVGDMSSGNGNGTLDQITSHFSQPLSQIKEVRVQTRPFQWIEFKDVELQPVK